LAATEKGTLPRRNLLDMSRSGYYAWRHRHACLETRRRRPAAWPSRPDTATPFTVHETRATSGWPCTRPVL